MFDNRKDGFSQDNRRFNHGSGWAGRKGEKEGFWMPPEEDLPEENPNKGLPLSRRRRLVVFGGSFNPVHRGHIELARKILEKGLGDEVMFIPAYCSPLKDGSLAASGEDRLAMLEAAICDARAEKVSYTAIEPTGRPEKVQKRDAVTGELVFNIHNQKPVFINVVPTKEVERKYIFSISDIELQRKGLSYTIDTLRSLRKVYQDAEIAFVIGGDCLENIERWHLVGELLQEFKVYVYPRNGAIFSHGDLEEKNRIFRLLEVKMGSNFAAKLCDGMLDSKDFPTLDVASSEIRSRIAMGEDVSEWLMPSVLSYIKEHKLYLN